MTGFVNMLEFNRAIKRWAKDKPPEAVNLMTRVLALRALEGVVMSTPVDIGEARFNWQTQIGLGDKSVIHGPYFGTDGSDPAIKSTTASLAISRGAAVIASLGNYSVVTIFNNLPYIETLEEGGFVPTDPGPSRDPRPWRTGRVWVSGGFSVQAPEGMVMKTTQDLRSIFP